MKLKVIPQDRLRRSGLGERRQNVSAKNFIRIIYKNLLEAFHELKFMCSLKGNNFLAKINGVMFTK